MLRSSISVCGLTDTALQVTESVPYKLLFFELRDGRRTRGLGGEFKTRTRDLEPEEVRGEIRVLTIEAEAIGLKTDVLRLYSLSIHQEQMPLQAHCETDISLFTFMRIYSA